MKKILVLVAGLVASSMSMAGVSSTFNGMHLHSSDFATKAEAYQADFDIKADLAAMNSKQLENKLLTHGADIRNLEIIGTEVAVEEFANDANQIVYRAVVDVDYSYDYND